MRKRGHHLPREQYILRADEYCKRGHDLPQTKLTTEQVKEAREYNKTAKQLAAEFGCHYRTIEKIRAYETWRHVK